MLDQQVSVYYVSFDVLSMFDCDGESPLFDVYVGRRNMMVVHGI
jgi:hypothetical protein